MLSVSEFIIRTIRTPGMPGVRIDIPVHATVEGLHTGCDEILEKALEMVRTGEYDPAAEK